MITRKDLKNLTHLRREIEYLENKIKNYKPAEIVADSVRGSSASFPYTEHSIVIEGLEQKEDKLAEFVKKLSRKKQELEEEEQRIELEVQEIPYPEIRMIIRYHFIEGLTYIQIMFKMNYYAPETPRMKLERYLGGNYEQD